MSYAAQSTRSKRGFTLVELLIVVGIVGILLGTVFVVINGPTVRAKARDAQRLSNLKSIQTAIELYKFSNGGYPVSSSWVAVGTADVLSTSLVPAFLSAIPKDSTYPASPQAICPTYIAGNTSYSYRTNASGTVYLLIAQMEVQSSAVSNPCSGLSLWTSMGCGPNLYCVGFESKE